MAARRGFETISSPFVSPNNRDNASGINVELARKMLNCNIKTLQLNRPTGEHVGCVLHLIKITERLMIRVDSKMSTPQIRAEMHKGRDDA